MRDFGVVGAERGMLELTQVRASWLPPSAHRWGEVVEVAGGVLADLRWPRSARRPGRRRPRRVRHRIGWPTRPRRNPTRTPRAGRRRAATSRRTAPSTSPTVPRRRSRCPAVPQLDHGDLGVQLGQPASPEIARRRVTIGRGVHEHDEHLAALRGPLDHVRVTEMRWIEAADDQTGRVVRLVGHPLLRHQFAQLTRPVHPADR